MKTHRVAAAFAALFLIGILIGGIQFFWNRPANKEFLPEAENDLILTVIGDEIPNDSERSINAHTEQESYPVGTKEIVLIITNHGEHALIYTGYYDFRHVDGDTVTPLSVRDDVVFDLEEHVLEPGETTRQTIAIDLFDQPLQPGIYRASQLACFSDTQGQALACSEITTDFVIE